MMVARRGTGEIAHARFRDLPEFLAPGDLLVVNNSETLPGRSRAGWKARRWSCDSRRRYPTGTGSSSCAGATSRLSPAAGRGSRGAARGSAR